MRTIPPASSVSGKFEEKDEFGKTYEKDWTIVRQPHNGLVRWNINDEQLTRNQKDIQEWDYLQSLSFYYNDIFYEYLT